jgi:hypothetical protein
MIIVDTSVWIDFFAGNENLESLWLRSEVGRPSIGLTDLILCEVLQGVRGEKMFASISRQLAKFPIFSTGGPELAIATHCIRQGHALLHRDRDFDPFERHLGLRVTHPNTQ